LYKYIKEKSELNMGEFFKLLASTMVISIDTEASSLDPITAEWILLQVKLNDEIYLFDVRTLEKKFLIYVVDLINSVQKVILAHNSKYDLKIIYRGTGILINNLHDTMLVESLLYRGIGRVFYSLAELVELYCSETLDKDVRTSFIEFKGELSAEQLSYSALDILYLETIYNKQMEYLLAKGLDRVYRLEMDLVPVLVIMELTGVYLDKEEWVALEKKAISDRDSSYKKVMDVLLDKIDFTSYANGAVLADSIHVPVTTKKARVALESLVDASVLKDWLRGSININSSKQLLAVLTKIFKLKLESTDEKVLKDVKDRSIIPFILDYRGFNKKITTYGEDFLKHVHPVTGRIHSEFLQNGTASGRFSCVPTSTEILTMDGWKKVNDLFIGEQVIGFDVQNYKYILTTLKYIHIGKDWVGRIKINRGHSLVRGIYCTSNHRWVVKDDKVVGFAEAQKIPKKFDTVIIPDATFPAPETSVLDETQAFLLGWFLTDGFKTGRENYGLGISLVKKRSIQILESWLIKESISYTKSLYKYPLDETHYINSFHISSSIFMPIYSIYKATTPSHLIMNLSEDARNSMLAAMLEGDGSIRRDKKRYDRFGASEIQEKNTCDYFELLMPALGKSYSFSILKGFNKKPFVNYQLLQKELVSDRNFNWKPEYETEVWCPETGCGTWVMRQGHIISITGNSTNPNLQNIPSDKEYRKPFKATPGKKLLSFDYSQQEYRLVGAISKDPVIIDSYVSGKDMHTATASIIYNKDMDKVTKEERSLGKTINFAVLYGSTAYGLAFNLKIEPKRADEFLRKFYEGYPTLTMFKRVVGDAIWAKKYSSTVMGRKRYWETKDFFADYKEADRYESRVRREGFNHIVQGTGADVTKLAMIKMFRENPFGDSFKLIMQIHDEIVVEVDEKIANEANEFGKKCMIDVFQPFLGAIPASVESHIDDHWTK